MARTRTGIEEQEEPNKSETFNYTKEEWEKICKTARNYSGDGYYGIEKRDRKYLGDTSILAKKVYKAPIANIRKDADNR